MKGGLWVAAAIAAAAGCSPGPEDITQAPKPATVSFAGKIEPRFVGNWATADGTSTIEMLKDGSANMVTVTRSPYGKVVNKVSGKWLADADNLLFDYSDKTHDMIVVKYGATLAGKTLTLAQAGGRLKTKYARKS